MILDLFVQRCEQRDVNLSSVCLAADVPFSTAFQHLKRMINGGLVEVTRSSEDQRVQYVRICDDAYGRLLTILSEY